MKGSPTQHRKQDEGEQEEKRQRGEREEQEAYEARSVINQLYWSLPTAKLA